MSKDQQEGDKNWLLSKVLAYCALSIFSATAARSQQIIKPENTEITFEGTIRLVHDYGPPGYGETPKIDAHVIYWAIEAPAPINTPCTSDRPEWKKIQCRPTKRMKLFFPGLELTKLGDLPAAKWRNQRVTIHGKLHRADTAAEMTPIYMDVTRITGPR